jgi:uncharacterized oxidoreductase
MPTVTRDEIVKIADVMLRAGGASEGHAMTVAEHLANANLAGHDSHGFIRIPQYLDAMKNGTLDPRAEPEVVGENAGTVQINGHGTFGQVVATMATRLGIEKARESGISLVTMGNLHHTGRIGTYPEMAAEEGMGAIMFTGFCGGTFGNNVAPFGGRARRLGTNPISMSFPHTDEGPVLLDFASSIAAEGKLRLYRNRGHQLPDEWVLDKDGVPSRDPQAYYDGGVILPVGGVSGGHKGYALSVMVSLYGALLGQIAAPESAQEDIWTGSSIIVINVGGMAPIDGIRSQVQSMTRYLKDTPTVEGVSEVLYPGEIEANSRRERLAGGVNIEQATWDQVAELMEAYGVAGELEEIGG